MFQTKTDCMDGRMLWLFYAAAAASFLPTLGYYYIGEEAIFPISSLEMHHAGQWLVQIMYGENLRHNPLFNWIIIFFSNIAGWEHMLPVTRAIAAASTLGSSLVLFWLCQRLFGNGNFAVFASISYLTLSDVSFYHGWLAYADPLFSFFIFSAIAFLWIGSEEKRRDFLFLAAILISLAFLTKAFTAYVFYGAAGLVLLRKNWRFLLNPFSLFIHAATVAFPFFWFSLLPSSGQGGRMLGEVAGKLSAQGSYAAQFFGFPVETMLRLLPFFPLVLYFLWRKRVKQEESGHFSTAFLIGFLNFLPYWLSPQSGIRYLLPIYPFFALVMARILWRAGEKAMRTTMAYVGAFIFLKWIAALFAFPYYQSHYRGENYYLAAQQIKKQTQGFPLYSSDVSSSGLSVTAYLDTLRLPEAPLAFPPIKWDTGFVLSYAENPQMGKTYRSFKLGGDTLYLLCRGKACEK